jgi:glycosyltransferase involved in cell wall biosynthesis
LNCGELAKVLLDLWKDPSTGTAQAEHNRLQVHKYSWESAARQYLNLFERMLHA